MTFPDDTEEPSIPITLVDATWIVWWGLVLLLVLSLAGLMTV